MTDPRTRETVPPEACPIDRELTRLCRAAVRERDKRKASRELVQAMIDDEACRRLWAAAARRS